MNQQLQELELATWIHKTYADAYRQKGDAVRALEYYQRYHVLNDSLYRQETHRQIAELEARYQTGKKEQTIATMQQERRLQDKALKRTHMRQVLALAAAGAIALLLFISIRTTRKVRRQQSQLTRQNGELTALNQVRTHLFSIISHDLRGLVMPLQQAGKLMQYQVKKERYDKVTDTAFALQENAERLSGMLDNLLHWSATQLKGYTLHPEPIDPARELHILLEAFSSLAMLKRITVAEELPEGLQLITDKGSFLLICRNLIGNALKFTPAGGTVTVGITEAGDRLSVTIGDTGPGMPAGIGADLAVTTAYRQENRDSKGLGLGLELVRQFTLLNQGKINMSAHDGGGTLIVVAFPLSPATTNKIP